MRREPMLTSQANDRINYILRDLLSQGYSEVCLGEKFYEKTNPAYRFAAYMALDLKESIGFLPSKELENMITFVVWNGKEPSSSEYISKKSWDE